VVHRLQLLPELVDPVLGPEQTSQAAEAPAVTAELEFEHIVRRLLGHARALRPLAHQVQDAARGFDAQPRHSRPLCRAVVVVVVVGLMGQVQVLDQSSLVAFGLASRLARHATLVHAILLVAGVRGGVLLFQLAVHVTQRRVMEPGKKKLFYYCLLLRHVILGYTIKYSIST